VPLPLPNLDTRRFDDLVAEMQALLPQYSPEWTNHNPSDPGMTLVELMAWITEATLYRANRIPDTTYRNLLALLLGESLKQSESMASDKVRALQFFHEPYRAVTAADFEREAKRANTEVARVRVLATAAEGRVIVVIVPQAGGAPAPGLVTAVKTRLAERKLVGTQVLVRGPMYTPIRLGMTVALDSNTKPDEVKNAVETAIGGYLDPLTGGPDGSGWPFGRSLSIFELYHLIEPISGVDHVEKIVLNGDQTIKEMAVPDLPRLTQLTVEVSP